MKYIKSHDSFINEGKITQSVIYGIINIANQLNKTHRSIS